jgi:hypothetical protein
VFKKKLIFLEIQFMKLRNFPIRIHGILSTSRHRRKQENRGDTCQGRIFYANKKGRDNDNTDGGE